MLKIKTVTAKNFPGHFPYDHGIPEGAFYLSGVIYDRTVAKWCG